MCALKTESGLPPSLQIEHHEDGELIRKCLGGSQEAWSALIDKYANLIYSIPLKYGASRDQAADIFQAVCLDLYQELDRLRDYGALRHWIARITANKCFHWKRRQGREVAVGMEDIENLGYPAGGGSGAAPSLPPDALRTLEEAEREQSIREAIRELPERCREMVRLLFFEDPPIPYEEVARQLGLAKGSIGFIRQRCLRKLERSLHARGLPGNDA
jgi:RNA polymerase sigma factor (sigma-70 family)